MTSRKNNIFSAVIALMLTAGMIISSAGACLAEAEPLDVQAKEGSTQDTVKASSSVASKKKPIKTPQELYGVATGAKKFNLNAKAGNGGTLTYRSSKKSIAKVSSKGVVKVGKKKGRAKITITEKSRESGEILAVKKVTVRVSSYMTPNGNMAQSNWNMDHKNGDFGNRDSYVSKYRYTKGSGPQNWTMVIRCTDPFVSNHAARAVTYIVNNKYFGYAENKPTSQKSVSNRASIYRAVHKVVGDDPSYDELKKIKSIRKYANTSCTPTLLAGYWLYIDMSSKIDLKWIPPYNKKAYTYQCGSVNVEYHQLEDAVKKVNKEYRSKGMLEPLEIIYVPSGRRSAWFGTGSMKSHLYRGDIVCSCPDYRRGGHTSMIL